MIKVKIFFLLSLALCISLTHAYAQNGFNGKDLLEAFNSNQISLSQATSALKNNTKLSTSEARQILTGVKDNIEGGAKLIDGLKAQIIPPDVAKFLSKVSDLGDFKLSLDEAGNLIGADKFKDILKNNDIQKEIDKFLKNGEIAKITDFVGSITNILGDVKNFENAIKDKLVGELEKVLPPELIALFGGFENFFSSMFGGLNSNSVVNQLGPPETGNYEIFEADPKSDPVPKSDPSCENCVCKVPIENVHIEIRKHVTDEFIKHRTWMIDEFFVKHILPAMTLMTTQFTTVAMQQVSMIGGFFDAKHQQETQRLFQQLMAEAHKDYQPSEGLCEIGTNVRSLSSSERKSKVSHIAFNKRLMDRQLRSKDSVASGGDTNSDLYNRTINFISKYCNKSDNTGGLAYLCKNGGNKPAQINKDINFIRTVESNLTLNIDPSEEAEEGNTDLEDVMALSANLFAHTPLEPLSGDTLATIEGDPKNLANRYMDLRSIAAKRSIATHSFSALIAERTNGDENVAPFLKKIVSEHNIPDEDVEKILGKNPSYFAQMEVLTKDIFQNPIFYTELYDKPANVLRKSASLNAIKLMQERDFYKSQLRSEMVLAVMLEAMLADERESIEKSLEALKDGDE
jgi:hypothetical protein